MNWSEMKASWEEMSVVITVHWPKLTDDELNDINGDRNELVRASTSLWVQRPASRNGDLRIRKRRALAGRRQVTLPCHA